VDGTILVVASGLTPKGALLATTEQLRRQGIVILGVILNRLDFNERLNGYGSYYRAYDKYYSSKSEPRTRISMWPWKRAVPVAPPGPKDGPDGRRVKRGAA
jgi:Mrp family chromosome partitioning ATPase